MLFVIMLMLSAVALFFASAAAMAAWVVQFIILNLTERRFRPLRWVTLIVPALTLCCAGLTESVIWLGAAGALFLGWGLAWPVYKWMCGGDRFRQAEPSGTGGKTGPNREGHV